MDHAIKLFGDTAGWEADQLRALQSLKAPTDHEIDWRGEGELFARIMRHSKLLLDAGVNLRPLEDVALKLFHHGGKLEHHGLAWRVSAGHFKPATVLMIVIGSMRPSQGDKHQMAATILWSWGKAVDVEPVVVTEERAIVDFSGGNSQSKPRQKSHRPKRSFKIRKVS